MCVKIGHITFFSLSSVVSQMVSLHSTNNCAHHCVEFTYLVIIYRLVHLKLKLYLTANRVSLMFVLSVMK